MLYLFAGGGGVAVFKAINVSSRGQALKTRWNLTTFKSIFCVFFF